VCRWLFADLEPDGPRSHPATSRWQPKAIRCSWHALARRMDRRSNPPAELEHFVSVAQRHPGECLSPRPGLAQDGTSPQECRRDQQAPNRPHRDRPSRNGNGRRLDEREVIEPRTRVARIRPPWRLSGDVGACRNDSCGCKESRSWKRWWDNRRPPALELEHGLRIVGSASPGVRIGRDPRHREGSHERRHSFWTGKAWAVAPRSK
jgi:hypothetical protein